MAAVQTSCAEKEKTLWRGTKQTKCNHGYCKKTLKGQKKSINCVCIIINYLIIVTSTLHFVNMFHISKHTLNSCGLKLATPQQSLVIWHGWGPISTQQEVEDLNLRGRSSVDINWHRSTANGRTQPVTSVVHRPHCQLWSWTLKPSTC